MAATCCRELGQPMDCQLWDTDLVLGVRSGLQPDEQICFNALFVNVGKVTLTICYLKKKRMFLH
ncbi:hypothetical protein IHE44_0004744 [Lamprotornis superbus]|uniref:Uncharacterized protein n=1 Tax=Lamprotornis superbus TaxID=245042 RepID=A0A835NFJ5_9PASS|nr:hypothetical protein IHE44_0004744 [Lamprotornis superbus]